ncbi:MAG: hypothetical protein QXJ48_07300 [Candidatus Korarchaeum sp.]
MLEHKYRESFETIGRFAGELIVLIVIVGLIFSLSSLTITKPQAISFLTDIERAVNDLRASGRLEVDEYETALSDAYVYANGSSLCVRSADRKVELSLPILFSSPIKVTLAEVKGESLCRDIGLDALIGEGRYDGKVFVRIYEREGKLIVELRGDRK